MAPGKKSKSASSAKSASSSKRRAKPSKGKEPASIAKKPESKIPEAVWKLAEKRGISDIEEPNSQDDGMNKPPKRRRKNAKKASLEFDDLVPREMPPPPRDYGASFARKSTAHYTWGAPLPARPAVIKGPERRNTSIRVGGKPKAKAKGKGKAKAKDKGKKAVAFGRNSIHAAAESDNEDIYSRTASPEPRNATPSNQKLEARVEDTLQHGPLFKLSTEVRINIYKYILVAEEPIRVRQGWSAVYPRNRPCLDVSLLRTCRQIRNEAINTLYGENTFQYLLREAAPVPSADEIVVRHPLAADDQQSEYEGDSDDNFSDDGRLPLARSIEDPEVEIDISRYGHKFRKLLIVAESNRYEKGYLLSMANAITVFRNLRPLRPRIHTISIEITPKRDPLTGELSFVNFFEKKSEVMRALKGTPCQFIEVIVNTGLNVGPDGQKKVLVNMKYAANIRRALRGQEDMWKDDHLMQENRVIQAGEAQGQLDELPGAIRKFWNDANKDVTVTDSDDEDLESDDLWGQP